MKQTEKNFAKEREEVKGYMSRIENALLSEKMQRAETEDFWKEKHQKEKADWTRKLVGLTESVAEMEVEI